MRTSTMEWYFLFPMLAVMTVGCEDRQPIIDALTNEKNELQDMVSVVDEKVEKLVVIEAIGNWFGRQEQKPYVERVREWVNNTPASMENLYSIYEQMGQAEALQGKMAELNSQDRDNASWLAGQQNNPQTSVKLKEVKTYEDALHNAMAKVRAGQSQPLR